jgi:hypothetical protein
VSKLRSYPTPQGVPRPDVYAGAKVELLELKDASHDFTGEREKKADGAMLAFLAQHLKEQPRPAAAR